MPGSRIEGAVPNPNPLQEVANVDTIRGPISRRPGQFVLAAVSMLLLLPYYAGAADRHRDQRRDRNIYQHRDIRRFHDHDIRVWRSGRWYHGHHDGRVGWWWIVGTLWYFYPRPIYPSPDPYLPPTVIVQPSPPPSRYDVWYYCDSARAYYPYVQSCPGGWRMVPANPAPPYRP